MRLARSLARPPFEPGPDNLKAGLPPCPPMRGLALLEGERVHRVVRRHPLGWLAHYAPGLGMLLLGALLALAWGSPAGQDFAAGLDASLGALAVPTLLALWWLGLAAATILPGVRLRAAWPLVLGVAVAVVGGFAAILLARPDPSAAEAAVLVPWVSLAAGVLGLAWAEALRLREAWVLTSFRIVRVHGLVHAQEEGWRLTRLARCNVERRGPRNLDFGDLVVVRKEGDPLRIPGVRPLHALADEVELLLHTTPEAPYLGEQRTTTERVTRLLRSPDDRRR
jgi:hypothetical protein